MVRIVHVDQRAQADAGLAFGTLFLIELGDLEERARVVGEQLVVPFDVHHVGVLGDGPEGCVRGHVHPGHRFVGACVSQRLVKPLLIGVGLGLGEHAGCGSGGLCGHSILLSRHCN